jgi:hypothetical protein
MHDPRLGVSNPRRGARDLVRLAPAVKTAEDPSPDEVAEALILLAGRRQIAATRAW